MFLCKTGTCLILGHLFDKVPRPGGSEVKLPPFLFSSPAATCYYLSNHSKERHLVRCLDQGHNK